MNKQDGIEERAKASVCQERYLQSTVYREGVDDATAEREAETATITDENNRLRDALRGVVDVLESQPSYESFHEYELSGTPDLCRRCGKYADHAYHGNALERAKALLDTAERATDADR